MTEAIVIPFDVVIIGVWVGNGVVGLYLAWRAIRWVARWVWDVEPKGRYARIENRREDRP